MNTSICKKVIGFDSWTGGSFNYARIAQELASRGCTFLVVHIDSWNGKRSQPAVQYVDGVEYRDISFYGTNNLEAVLHAESPEAVIFLSVDTFAHRAFNRLAKKNRIPTMNLYHGLITVQSVDSGRPYKVKAVAQALFVLERIPKALTRIWPAYASVLFATRATLRDWLRFVSDIIFMSIGHRRHTAARDARTTCCCVYTSADVKHAMVRYGFSEAEVVAVGNPDLHRFGLLSDDIGSRLTGACGNEIMYIDTGLINTGFVFSSRSEFVRYMLDIRDSLFSQGFNMLLKPHPSHGGTGLLEELSDMGLRICENHDFVSKLRTCRAAIVEPSTLAVVPALMGLPLLLNQSSALSSQQYGEVLTSYPRRIFLHDFEKSLELICKIESEPIFDAVIDWIKINSGPLPYEAMPSRVADLLGKLVGNSGLSSPIS